VPGLRKENLLIESEGADLDPHRHSYCRLYVQLRIISNITVTAQSVLGVVEGARVITIEYIAVPVSVINYANAGVTGALKERAVKVVAAAVVGRAVVKRPVPYKIRVDGNRRVWQKPQHQIKKD
jgi:hypothetical protein